MLAKAQSLCPLNCREEDDDATAYQRQYDDDHSWEELQEDAFGNLVSLVSSHYLKACLECNFLNLALLSVFCRPSVSRIDEVLHYQSPTKILMNGFLAFLASIQFA